MHVLLVAGAGLLNLKASIDPEDLVVNRTVIPTLMRPWESQASFREKREQLFAAGLYPGVDYKILSLEEGTVTVRPEYPLVAKLEREWPVTVPTDLAPRWMDPMAYNLLTAVFAVGLGIGGLGIGVLLSSVLTLSVVPSGSMQPTIEPGDVLLVEKLSQRLGVRPSANDLVFFEPPDALAAIVQSREAAAAAAAADSGGGGGGRSGLSALKSRLFVKRVVGEPGDEVSVSPEGSVRVRGAEILRARLASSVSIQPLESFRLRSDEYFVLGDNGEVSVDSRCWGALPRQKIAGRPLMRVLPPSRFGAVK